MANLFHTGRSSNKFADAIPSLRSVQIFPAATSFYLGGMHATLRCCPHQHTLTSREVARRAPFSCRWNSIVISMPATSTCSIDWLSVVDVDPRPWHPSRPNAAHQRRGVTGTASQPVIDRASNLQKSTWATHQGVPITSRQRSPRLKRGWVEPSAAGTHAQTTTRPSQESVLSGESILPTPYGPGKSPSRALNPSLVCGSKAFIPSVAESLIARNGE